MSRIKLLKDVIDDGMLWRIAEHLAKAISEPTLLHKNRKLLLTLSDNAINWQENLNGFEELKLY